MKLDRIGRWGVLARSAAVVVGLALAATGCARLCCRDTAGQPLFNGKDLSGWEATGNAAWSVEDGCLVGRQGPNGAAGDLFTEQEYDDFEVTVTFKMNWPGNSGVWFRYLAPDKSYQADILEYENPECYAGTLYCPGKMFLSMNEDPAIVNRDGWNTIKIRAQGDHLVITLNDVVTGDVHEDSFSRGKIGFQIHAGDQFKDMQITVREAVIEPLQ
jgi:3-keto-disaccharide hydrolase